MKEIFSKARVIINDNGFFVSAQSAAGSVNSKEVSMAFLTMDTTAWAELRKG